MYVEYTIAANIGLLKREGQQIRLFKKDERCDTEQVNLCKSWYRSTERPRRAFSPSPGARSEISPHWCIDSSLEMIISFPESSRTTDRLEPNPHFYPKPLPYFTLRIKQHLYLINTHGPPGVEKAVVFHKENWIGAPLVPLSFTIAPERHPSQSACRRLLYVESGATRVCVPTTPAML